MFGGYLCMASVALGFCAGGSARADEVPRFQGLFCNTEAQIDQALADISAGVSARQAADRANREAVVCTYVDRIEYLIARPVALGGTALPLVKYRGALVGVSVGGDLRPVTPEAELYFLTPVKVVGAAIERRI